jgi:hypothetical protein
MLPLGYGYARCLLRWSLSDNTLPALPLTSIFLKANELANLTKSLTSSLVSAYGCGDAECLTTLRSAHERAVLDLGLETS